MTTDELMALADALFEAGHYEAMTGEGATGDSCARAEEKSTAARNALRTVLEAVVADARRLDFLDTLTKQDPGAADVPVRSDMHFVYGSVSVYAWEMTGGGLWRTERANVRSAIDAAIDTMRAAGGA
jgi:hypothetical protein